MDIRDKRNLILLLSSIFVSFIIILSAKLVSSNPIKSGPPGNKHSSHRTGRKCNNPLYDKLISAGKKQRLKLEFTCNIQEIAGRMRSFKSAIFCSRPNSLDVILFGDSTIGWGIMPQVIEQKTGLKVGIFSLRGMYLNKKSLSVLQRIRKYFLKKNGISIFAFDQWTQEKNPNIFRRSDELSDISKMSDHKFNRFAEQRFKLCNGFDVVRSRKQTDNPFTGTIYQSAALFSIDEYKKYHAGALLIQEFLRKKAWLHLPRRTYLHAKISSIFNPAWYSKKKMEDISSAGSPIDESIYSSINSTGNNPYKFIKKGLVSRIRNQRIWIRWDHYTLTIYMKKPPRLSIFSNRQPRKEFFISPYLKENAEALKNFPGRKAYLITFYPRHRFYVVLRSYYKQLYEGSLELIDLGLLHPRHGGYPMDYKAHLVNTGGLYKSLAIARWIRKYFSKGH